MKSLNFFVASTATFLMTASLGLSAGTMEEHHEAMKSEKVSLSEMEIEKKGIHKLVHEGGTYYSQVVEFDENNAMLTEDSKENLRDLITHVTNVGEIENIKVVSWSDAEFPAPEGKKLTKEDKQLAKERLTNINQFLSQNYNVTTDGLNMAEEPGLIAEVFNTESAELKSIFAKKEMRSEDIEKPELRILHQRGEPGAAVVLVEMKGLRESQAPQDSVDVQYPN